MLKTFYKNRRPEEGKKNFGITYSFITFSLSYYLLMLSLLFSASILNLREF